MYSDERQFSDVEYYSGSPFPRYEERERSTAGSTRSNASARAAAGSAKNRQTGSCRRGVVCEKRRIQGQGVTLADLKVGLRKCRHRRCGRWR